MINQYNLSKNTSLTIFKTNKYKDINLSLHLTMPLNVKQIPLFYILEKYIGRYSKDFKNKQQIANKIEELYDCNFNVSYSNNFKLSTLSVYYNFINPKYLDDVNILLFKDFFEALFFKVEINEKNLNEIKKQVIQSLTRKLENPVSVLHNSVNTIIYKNNKIGMNYQKIINYTKKVKLQDIVNLYTYLIKKAQVDIYVFGDIDKKLFTIINKYNYGDKPNLEIENKKLILNCTKEHFNSTIKAKQSELAIVYKTPFNRFHKLYYAWLMCDYILGGGAFSLLFTNIREKLSLCYSIYAFNNKDIGLTRIYTSIDHKNVDIVINEVANQIAIIKKGEFSDDLLKTAKTMYINNLNSIKDDYSELSEFMHMSKLYGTNITIDEYIDNINAVSKEDIMQAISKYKQAFIYELKGETNEKTSNK